MTGLHVRWGSAAFVFGTLLLFSLGFGALIHGGQEHRRRGWEPSALDGVPWIEPAAPAASGYFRRRFRLPSKPTKAYLVAAGRDELAVFANGIPVGNAQLLDGRPTTIIDVTQQLNRGENLLAIKVEGNRAGLAPDLAARLEIAFASGADRTIRTDSAWRAEARESFQASRDASWSSTAFDDSGWPNAAVALLEDDRAIAPLPVPEAVYRSLPAGFRIARGTGGAGATQFVRAFDVTAPVAGAWLAIGSDGRYTVTLNGSRLVSRTGTSKSMDLFDISPYVLRGENQLLVQLADGDPRRSLAVSGFVATPTGRVELHSDDRWRAFEGDTASAAASGTSEVLLLSRIAGNTNPGTPALALQTLEPPDALSQLGALGLLTISGGVFWVSVLTLLLFCQAARMSGFEVSWRSLETFSLPFGWMALAIGLLLVASYDPGIPSDLPFRPSILATIAAATLLWEIVIVAELRHGGTR